MSLKQVNSIFCILKSIIISIRNIITFVCKKTASFIVFLFEEIILLSFKILTKMFGFLIYNGLPKRKRRLLGNFFTAFPEKSDDWRRKSAKISCERTVEMALFVIFSSICSLKRIKKCVELDDSIKKACEILVSKNIENLENSDKFQNSDEKSDLNSPKKPLLVLVPHFSLMQSILFMPALIPGVKKLQIGVLYRPFFNLFLEKFVKKARERFGIQLLSRKTGLIKVRRILQNNGIVALLFDQNAGMAGRSCLFFGEFASCTRLPDQLVRETGASVAIIYPKRIGFMSCKLYFEKLETKNDFELPVLLQSNLWLENKLKDENFCNDWLWLHDRWKDNRIFETRFNLSEKKLYLKEQLNFLDLEKLPKKERVWFRMPNWLGDLIMAIPFIRTIKNARPDFEITLLAKPNFIEFLKSLDLAENYISLPNNKRNPLAYFKYFIKFRKFYPETVVLFIKSFRARLEDRIIGSYQRFGISKKDFLPSFLTHKWECPSDLKSNSVHETKVWEHFFAHFGLKEKVDYKPIELPNRSKMSSKQEYSGELKHDNKFKIGIFYGSENTPEKRWPADCFVNFFKLLNDQIPNAKVILFGTKNEISIANEILEKSKEENISLEFENFTGKTDLVGLTNEILKCNCIVSNDNGGMHLSNAMGVPVICIFGPTNHLKTGPIYDGLAKIIRPKKKSSSMREIDAKEVLNSVLEFIFKT